MSVEEIIQSIIWEILKLNFDDGKVVTARNDVQTNMTILRNIAAHRLNEDRLGLLHSILDRVKDAQEYRNTVVLAQWIMLRPMNVPAAMSIRWKAIEEDSVTSEACPPQRMREIIKLTDSCASDLDGFFRELEALHGKLTPQHPQD